MASWPPRFWLYALLCTAPTAQLVVAHMVQAALTPMSPLGSPMPPFLQNGSLCRFVHGRQLQQQPLQQPPPQYHQQQQQQLYYQQQWRAGPPPPPRLQRPPPVSARHAIDPENLSSLVPRTYLEASDPSRGSGSMSRSSSQPSVAHATATVTWVPPATAPGAAAGGACQATGGAPAAAAAPPVGKPARQPPPQPPSQQAQPQQEEDKQQQQQQQHLQEQQQGGASKREISADERGLLQRRFHSLLCPLTLAPFDDPVIAADGNVYERQAIESWLYRWGRGGGAAGVHGGVHGRAGRVCCTCCRQQQSSPSSGRTPALIRCPCCLPACLPACREGNDASPVTKERLPHKMLMECGSMRRCVEDVLRYVAAMRQQVF